MGTAIGILIKWNLFSRSNEKRKINSAGLCGAGQFPKKLEKASNKDTLKGLREIEKTNNRLDEKVVRK